MRILAFLPCVLCCSIGVGACNTPNNPASQAKAYTAGQATCFATSEVNFQSRADGCWATKKTSVADQCPPDKLPAALQSVTNAMTLHYRQFTAAMMPPDIFNWLENQHSRDDIKLNNNQLNMTRNKELPTRIGASDEYQNLPQHQADKIDVSPSGEVLFESKVWTAPCNNFEAWRDQAPTDGLYAKLVRAAAVGWQDHSLSTMFDWMVTNLKRACTGEPITYGSDPVNS